MYATLLFVLDTPNCIGPYLCSISLCSGSVFTLNKPRNIGDSSNVGVQDASCEDVEVTASETVCSTTTDKKDFYLPRRSLLILTDDARYTWQHRCVCVCELFECYECCYICCMHTPISITSRVLDQVNGELMLRNRRVSLTFREVCVPLLHFPMALLYLM